MGSLSAAAVPRGAEAASRLGDSGGIDRWGMKREMDMSGKVAGFGPEARRPNGGRPRGRDHRTPGAPIGGVCRSSRHLVRLRPATPAT